MKYDSKTEVIWHHDQLPTGIVAVILDSDGIEVIHES